MKVEAKSKPKNINLIIGRRQCGKTNKLIKAVLKNLITSVYDFRHQFAKGLDDLTPQFLILVVDKQFKKYFEGKIRPIFSEQALEVVDRLLVIDEHHNDPETLKKVLEGISRNGHSKLIQSVSIDDWPVEHVSYLKEINQMIPQAFVNVIVWDKVSDKKDYEEMSR